MPKLNYHDIEFIYTKIPYEKLKYLGYIFNLIYDPYN